MVLKNPLDALKNKTNIFDYAANNFSVPEKKEQYMTPIPKPKTTQPIQQTIKPTTIQQKTAQNFNLQPKFESNNLFDAQRSEKPLEEMGALEKRQELYKRYGYQTTSLGQLADSFQSRFVDTIGASARGISDMGFGAISDLVSDKSYESAPAQLALGGGPIINLVTAKIKSYLKNQGINAQEKIDTLQKTSKDEINSIVNNYLDQRPRLKEVQEMNEQKAAIQAIGEGDRQTLGNKMADTVGQALPAIVAGFVTKNPMLVFGTIFPQMKDEITEDLTNDKSLNLSTQQINKLSTGIGAISTLVETVSNVIQLGPLMKPFTKEITNQLVRKAVTKGVISQGLVQMLKGMGSEGVEEVIQSAIQNLTAIGLGSDRDFLELKEYASIFLESAILSLGISLPGGVMQSIQQKKLNDMIKQNPDGVKTVEEFLDSMNQVAIEDIDDDSLPPSAGMIEQSELEQVDQTKYQTIQQAIPEETRAGIQKYKKARIEDVIDKLPDISLDKDLVIKDIQGDKFTITEGTPLTPYQMVGGKVLLQNGTTYIVPNNQFLNIKNQSTVLEAKEFAPELKGTEETILGAKDYAKIDLSEEGSYESLPQEVRDIIEKYSDQEGDYTALKEMGKELKAIGWEQDYDLDGEVTGLSRIEEGKPTKYEKYTLPGGENYKEILIQAPKTPSVDVPVWKKVYEGNLVAKTKVGGVNYEIGGTRGDYKIYKNGIQRGRGETLEGTKDTVQKIIDKKLVSNFRGSHREQPNVLAHLRLNEREYNGQKVTFMEELQSDWARESRKNPPKTTEEIKADKEFADYGKSMWEKYGDNINRLNTTISLITRYGTTEELIKYNELSEKTIIRDIIPTDERLKNRQTLAIKRALSEAAENGSEYFSWINGEETAARYSLEKHIDSIGWETNKQYETYGFKVIRIKPKQGSRIDLIINKVGKITDAPKTEREGKNISDVIGKGLADQIMGNNEGTIDGNGLKIGGERAYNMYDKQVTNIVKDLTGQTPEKIDLGIKPEQPSPGLYIRTDNGVRSITNNDIKVGISFENGDNREFVIVEVLGDGKFKAVPRIILQPAARRGSLAEGVDWTPVNIRTVEYYYNPKNVSEISLPKQREPQQFQSIKLTPEVKAIIKGQAPLRAKPSGKALEDIFVPELYQLFKKATKQPISKEEALKIVRKYFDANELSVYFAQKISTPEGLLAFGKYVKGVITFIENPDISTPRHEVVHAYLDLFVSPQRKAEILADVKNSVAYKDYLNGEKPTIENAEEFLADLGNEYMTKKELPSNIGQKIIDFLRDLLQSFKKFFGKEDKMVDLFNDIMNKNRDYISDKFGDMTKYEDFGNNTKSDQFEAVDKYDEFTNLDIDYLESLSAPRKKYKPKTEMEKQLKKQLLLKKEEVEQKKIEQQEKKLDEQIQQRIEPKKKRLITPKEGPNFGKVDKYNAAKYFKDKTDVIKPALTIKQQEKKVEKIINKTVLPELKYNDNSIWYNIKKIYRRALDNFAIGRYGEEGKEIFEKIKQAEKRSVIKASDDIVKLDKALKPLSDEEMADFGGYVEKKIAIPNDKVQNAVNVWNTVSNNIASYAQQYGLQIKTPEGYRDFIPRQNYYPYYIKEDILTERLSNKEKYRELINKIAEENKITIAEAADFLRMLANNKADFFGHLERSRGANLPSQFYERDPRNILAAYIGKGYDRLGIIKEFGAKDEILNDLISEAMEKGEDVEEIKLLSDVLLGRKEYHIAASKVSNTLRMYNNITKLSLAAVTNLGDIIKPFVRTNPISALIGIKDTFTKKGQEFGAKVGVTNTLLENYATEQGLGNKFFKRSGFKKSEETLRKISANAARNYLDVLWKKLEKNPNNKFARRRIEQFGINPQDLIENGGPTESDYIEAGYQSIADTQPTSKTDMPYYFQTPAGKVLTQYKQFAYKHFNFAKKFIFAELGKGNVVPLLMFLILGQAVGEGVADLKAFIRGRDRVGTIGKRIIDNYITVGGLGLATDFITAIQNQGYGSPFLKFIVGPTFSDMDAILTAIVGDINSLKKGKDFVYGKVAGTGQTQFKTLKNALNKLPFVGPFLANKIMPTNAPYQARTPGLTDDILQLLGIEQDLEQSNNTSLKKKVTKKPTKKKVTKKK